MILAFTISPSVASIVVIVAAVPTMSVIIPEVILTSLRSAVSVSRVAMVAPVPTMSVTAIPVKLRLSALRVVMCAVVNVA